MTFHGEMETFSISKRVPLAEIYSCNFGSLQVCNDADLTPIGTVPCSSLPPPWTTTSRQHENSTSSNAVYTASVLALTQVSLKQIKCDGAPTMVGKSEDMMWKSESGSGKTCDDSPSDPQTEGPQSRFGNLHILNDVNPCVLNRRFGNVNVNPTQRSGS